MDIQNKSKLYSIFKIKKPNKKDRVIMAPCYELKQKQEQIAKKLNKIQLSEFCYGFRKGYSVYNAVSKHVKKDWIFKIDIKDFFPSITIDKLNFLNDYEKEIVTLNGRLVQGSPSSPVISNIVFKKLDTKLGNYFKDLNISYSRYVDDILISGIGNFNVKHSKFIIKNLKKNDFKINCKKTKLMFKNDRMKALGVTLNNEIPSCNREKRRKLRVAIKKDNINESDIGYLSYIKSINKKQYDKLIAGKMNRLSG